MNCCPSPTNHELGDIEQVSSNRRVSKSFVRFFDPFRSFVASTRACFEPSRGQAASKRSRVEHCRLSGSFVARFCGRSRGFEGSRGARKQALFEVFRGQEASKRAMSSMFDVRMLRRELRGASSRPRGVESKRFVETRAVFFRSEPSRARVRKAVSCELSRVKSKVYVWCLRSD